MKTIITYDSETAFVETPIDSNITHTEIVKESLKTLSTVCTVFNGKRFADFCLQRGKLIYGVTIDGQLSRSDVELLKRVDQHLVITNIE